MTRFSAIKIVLIWLALSLSLGAGHAYAQSGVSVTVNSAPITDAQIDQRARLLQLERRGTSNADRRTMATNELIDEALKVQEAERIGITVSSNQVDEAVATVARNMNISQSNLSQILSSNGTNIETLRARLRAAIAWQGVSQQAISPRVQVSELDLDLRAAEQVEESTSYDYILKEVIFVIPQGSGGSASRRTAEANQYRSRFQGCDTAVDLAITFTDAAVRDVGRRHATQLPDAVASELARLNVGGLTSPRVGENGVTMLAVCSKTAARDLTFIRQELRQEAGAEQFQVEAEAYLATLRERATIQRR